MKSKVYLILIMLLLPCCFFNVSSDVKKTFIIQGVFEPRIITTIQESLSSEIDKIIFEETGLKSEKDLPLFFFKKRAAITVYYVNDMISDAEPILLAELEALKKLQAPKNLGISSKVTFFGDPKKDDPMGLIDLVIFIDDPKANLLNIHEETKKYVHVANEKYKKTSKQDMYDIAKSERYSYTTHLSIGHLRVNYIKNKMNGNSSKIEKIMENLKQRIVNAVIDKLLTITNEEKRIIIDKVGVYDLQKRIYVKDYVLMS